MRSFRSVIAFSRSGTGTSCARAVDAAKEAGAKRAVELPVSVPSHCDLMRPAAEKLAVKLADVAVSTPTIPVLHNVSVTTESDPDTIRRRLVEQLHSPVRWVETIEAMKDGVSKSLEDLADIGGKVQDAAIRAGYGPTIRAESVKKLVDSVITWQERSHEIIAEMRQLATQNAEEIRTSVENGKRQLARLAEEGKGLALELKA